MFLKQNTARTVKIGPFLDDTDGKTAEGGLTISQTDIRLSKNGGDFAQTNNSAGAMHDENGWYDVPLNAADTNTIGELKVAIHKAGALPCQAIFTVLNANAYENLLGGLATKVLVNKAVQNKATGEIEYFDDDGATVILTHTPTDDESTITRTPS